MLPERIPLELLSVPATPLVALPPFQHPPADALCLV